VLVRGHAATGKTASPRHRLDLQSQVQKADGVIAVDGALELQRSRQRRICRSLMPMISAACHHVILFAMARKITSCTFIARSTAAFG